MAAKPKPKRKLPPWLMKGPSLLDKAVAAGKKGKKS